MVFSWITNIIFFFIVVNNNFPIASNQFNEVIVLPEVVMQDLVEADKAAVLSPDGRTLLFNKKADEQQPIASITKLMTALVFLDLNIDWNQTYKISSKDSISGGRLHLFPGDTVNLKDLFLTSLVASDNGATIALVHASGLTEKDFVAKMNERAQDLYLYKTKFIEPTGLDAGNISTAREVALLAKTALSYSEISEAVSLKDYTFLTLDGKEKFIESTDNLLFDSNPGNLKSLGGKTGYTDVAGYCFVGRFNGLGGEDLIAVVLKSSKSNDRFKESKVLIDWVLTNHFKK